MFSAVESMGCVDSGSCFFCISGKSLAFWASKSFVEMFVHNSMLLKETWEMPKITHCFLSLETVLSDDGMVTLAIIQLSLYYKRPQYRCSPKIWNWSGLRRCLYINRMIIWHTSKCLERLSETWLICMKKKMWP